MPQKISLLVKKINFFNKGKTLTSMRRRKKYQPEKLKEAVKMVGDWVLDHSRTS